MRDQGGTAENFSTDDPRVLLIIATMKSAKGDFKRGAADSSNRCINRSEHIDLGVHLKGV